MSSSKSLQHKAANGETPQGNYSVQQVEVHQGLLPRPDDLEKYERLCPGLANRMMAMAEEEQSHRQQQEKEIVLGELEHQRRVDRAAFKGQWFAAFVAIVIACLSGYAMYLGFGNEGRWIACTVIGAAVVAFLTIQGQTKTPKKE